MAFAGLGLAAATGGGPLRSSASPAPIVHIAVIAMSRSNWVMAYSSQGNRPQRFDEPERRWVELQENLNRWGGSHTWQQLQQLGQIARTN